MVSPRFGDLTIWLPHGTLLDAYPHMVVYKSALSLDLDLDPLCLLSSNLTNRRDRLFLRAQLFFSDMEERTVTQLLGRAPDEWSPEPA